MSIFPHFWEKVFNSVLSNGTVKHILDTSRNDVVQYKPFLSQMINNKCSVI